MPRFILTCEHSENHTNSMEFTEDFLHDVVANMDTFLRGCGFVFDGCLTIEYAEPKKEETHSKYYFDFDRNR